MNGKIQIVCPPMEVLHVDIRTGQPLPSGVKQAQELECKGFLEMDSGIVHYFEITFPWCFVRKKSLTHWIVDKVTAISGKLGQIESIQVTLPPEDCFLKWSLFPPKIWMLAKAVNTVSPSYLILNGQRGDISMVFPDAPSHPIGSIFSGDWMVEEVTATGICSFE